MTSDAYVYNKNNRSLREYRILSECVINIIKAASGKQGGLIESIAGSGSAGKQCPYAMVVGSSFS